MKITAPPIHLALILMPLFAFTLPAHAADYSTVLQGSIIEQVAFRQLRDDYLLNPQGGILKLPAKMNTVSADIDFRLAHHDTGLQAKFRPTLGTEDGSSQSRLIVTESYLDTGISENMFFYAGKKNIREGVGLGANPTDFLGEGKEVDHSKREEERRLEREGNLLAGLDLFFNDLTLTALIAPRLDSLQEENSRFLFKAAFLLEDYNTDVSLHLFSGDIPGVGLNISSTINDQLVLYTEAAGRRGGREKLAGTGNQGLNAALIPAARHKTYPHLVAGGHYTFQDRTNIIVEYIYKGDGYDNQEWNSFISLLQHSAEAYSNGFSKEAMRRNLLQANRLMDIGSMRRNYIFARISNPEIREKFDAALVGILNVDDRSFLLNPSLSYSLDEHIVLSLHATIFKGGREAEFGLSHWQSETGLSCKYSF